MRPGHARLFWWGALICLPAVLLCLVGGYFLIEEVPAIGRRQKGRLTRDCRREAERLAETLPADGHMLPSRPKGWRQAGKLKTGQRWGYVEAEQIEPARGRDRLVWLESAEGRVRTVWLEAGDEPDVEQLFLFAIPTILFIIWLLTAIGLWYFIRFVRSREDFLAAAAHDLTTPLVGLRMMIGRNDEEARVLNERLLRIVANINDFLKLGGKRPAPKRERVDLVACYREAYALFREDFRELNGGADLALDLEGDGPVPVCGDMTLIVQILWNLLGNDLKYAAPYGKVSLRIRTVGTRVYLELTDFGPGMSARERRRAFDRYYRAKDVLTSGKGGFGIGLCAAREFARAMSGDLTVAANRPKGCVFTLDLPAFGEREG